MDIALPRSRYQTFKTLVCLLEKFRPGQDPVEALLNIEEERLGAEDGFMNCRGGAEEWEASGRNLEQFKADRMNGTLLNT